MTFDALYEWLISAEYDETLDAGERNALAEIRGLALDVAENRLGRFVLEQCIMELIQTVIGAPVYGGRAIDLHHQLKSSWATYCWAESEVVSDVLRIKSRRRATPASVSTSSAMEAADQPQQVLVGGPR